MIQETAPDFPSGPSPAAAPGLLRSAGIVSAAVAVSRVTGLVRESVLGWLFGAGAVFDAYVLGYRVPNLARDLFAEGALSAAFVPTFSRYLATKTKEEARELSNIVGHPADVAGGLTLPFRHGLQRRHS